jgi:CheY-like chemotaxis protein
MPLRSPLTTAQTVPIISVSATSGEDIVERGLRHGMNATIAKPTRSRQL